MLIEYVSHKSNYGNRNNLHLISFTKRNKTLNMYVLVIISTPNFIN